MILFAHDVEVSWPDKFRCRATGTNTVIDRVTGMPPTSPKVIAGQGPVRHCVRRGANSAVLAAARLGAGCISVARPTIDGDSASYAVKCAGQTQSIQIRRTRTDTWVMRAVIEDSATAPAAPATAQAMAPVIAQM
jgi:hypothetical protein